MFKPSRGHMSYCLAPVQGTKPEIMITWRIPDADPEIAHSYVRQICLRFKYYKLLPNTLTAPMTLSQYPRLTRQAKRHETLTELTTSWPPVGIT